MMIIPIFLGTSLTPLALVLMAVVLGGVLYGVIRMLDNKKQRNKRGEQFNVSKVICPNCGTAMDEDKKFCTKCGMTLSK